MLMIRWIVFLFVLGAVTDELAFGQEVPFTEKSAFNSEALLTHEVHIEDSHFEGASQIP